MTATETQSTTVTIRDICDFINSYRPHGHVVERDDVAFRCGGPGICKGCDMEQAIIEAMKVYG